MLESFKVSTGVLEYLDQSPQIMDYSLLLGIHNLDQAAREKAENASSAEDRFKQTGVLVTDLLMQSEGSAEEEDGWSRSDGEYTGER